MSTTSTRRTSGAPAPSAPEIQALQPEAAQPAEGTAAESNPLKGLKFIDAWLLEEGADAFPGPRSWEWFKRQHGVELVERGALLLGAGRRGDMATPALATVVRGILDRETQVRAQQLRARSARSVSAIASRAVIGASTAP